MKNTSDYRISAAEHEGVVEITIAGKVIKKDAKKINDDVLGQAKAHNAKYLLVDVRALEGRFGFAEAYYRVRSYPADRATLHTAVVDIQEREEFESFHETTARNVGISMKWFTDIDAAREWLKDMKKAGSE